VPIQIATFDLEDYRRGRREMTTDEWLDLLVRSMGYVPTEMTRRLKLLLLVRLVPLAERNFNLVELGPRGTGKSYVIQEVSPYAALLTGPLGVAFFVACYSALRKLPVSPALPVLGDLSVQGNVKPLRSLTEPLQVAKDHGAKRALIPIENKRNFLDVAADIMEHVDPIFFGDPKIGAMKALGLT
jgi:predicted ATP-dependent Lon-type protease